MKPLSACCNGDGRPVQPPSKVLCKECFAELDKQMYRLLSHPAHQATPDAREGE